MEPSLHLGANVVDLWVINLTDVSYVPDASNAEQERAGQFRRRSDGDRYLVAHGALRRILAGYTHAEPSALQFTLGAFGKPALVDSDLEFNLSHSGERALIAVAHARAVGVDIEQYRPLPDLDNLADLVCTPSERAILANMPSTERELAFFAFWTCKEAVAKMTGVGIRAIDPYAHLPSTASLADHRVEPLVDLSGYAACVAAIGVDWRVVRRN